MYLLCIKDFIHMHGWQWQKEWQCKWKTQILKKILSCLIGFIKTFIIYALLSLFLKLFANLVTSPAEILSGMASSKLTSSFSISSIHRTEICLPTNCSPQSSLNTNSSPWNTQHLSTQNSCYTQMFRTGSLLNLKPLTFIKKRSLLPPNFSALKSLLVSR